MSPKKQKKSPEIIAQPSDSSVGKPSEIGKIALDNPPWHEQAMGPFSFHAWGDERVVDPTEVTVEHAETNGHSLSNDWDTIEGNRLIVSIGGLQFLPPHMREEEVERSRKYLKDTIGACRAKVIAALDRGLDRDNSYTQHVALLSDQLPEHLAASLVLNCEKGSTLLHQLGSADDETLADFMIWHGRFLQQENEKMKPEFEKYKQEFLVAVRDAIEHHNLPLSLKQLETRMENVSITLGDPLALRLESVGGYYEVLTRDVYIARFSDSELTKKVVFHELMHHLSGQTTSQIGHEEEYTYNRGERSGLSFPGGQKAPTWINEALTEQLSQVLLAGGEIDYSTATTEDFFEIKQGAYPVERDATSVTMRDIPLPKLLTAYFEDAVLADDGTALPATREFWDTVTDELGDGFVELATKYRIFGNNLSKLREYFGTLQEISKLEVPDIVDSEKAVIAAALAKTIMYLGKNNYFD